MAMYRSLGNSGLWVSNMCLGTMTFGPHERPGNCNEELAHSIIDRYVELKGNFIDTADVYCDGESEKIIGTWLEKNASMRDQLVIATKARFATGTQGPVNGVCLSRKHLIKCVEQSLQRLRTDYVDLLQFHCWDSSTPLEESVRTIDDLVKAGKIRYFGVSNFCGWQLQKLADMCDRMGLTRCISLQQQYSLLNREAELEMFDVCKNEGIGFLPWSPLKGGWLTGKIQRSANAAPEGSRVHYSSAKGMSRLQSHPAYETFANDEQVWSLIDTLHSLAKKYGKSVSQISLRWAIQKPQVTSLVFGCKTVAQLEDNMGAADGWDISEEDMQQLDKASQKPLPYPYELIARTSTTRQTY